MYHWRRTKCLVATVFILQYLHSDLVPDRHHFRAGKGFNWTGAELRPYIAAIAIYVKLLLTKQRSKKY